jgi:AraC family transcriptional regulator
MTMIGSNLPLLNGSSRRLNPHGFGDAHGGHSPFLLSRERVGRRSPVVHAETQWRQPDILKSIEPHNPRLIVSRWNGADRQEHFCEIDGDYHLLAIAIQPTRFSMSVGTKLVPFHDVVPGMVQITAPGVAARAVHVRPYDVLHVHVPNVLLQECLEWSNIKWRSGEFALCDPLWAQDPTLHRLGDRLVSIDEQGEPCGGLLVDFVGLAMVMHLVGQYGDGGTPASGKPAALPKWRLKRVLQFVDA